MFIISRNHLLVVSGDIYYSLIVPVLFVHMLLCFDLTTDNKVRTNSTRNNTEDIVARSLQLARL